MSVMDRLVELLVEFLKVDGETVNVESSIVKDLGADELQEVELLCLVEEEFGLKIPDVDFDRTKTVGGLVEYLEARIE